MATESDNLGNKPFLCIQLTAIIDNFSHWNVVLMEEILKKPMLKLYISLPKVSFARKPVLTTPYSA